MDPTKLDSRLGARWHEYQRAAEAGAPGAQRGDLHVRVAVVFEGDRERLAAAGLVVRSVYGPVAYGSVRVADLGRLGSLPEVKRVESESRARTSLDDSVPEILVPPVWSGAPSFKGTGVIVGVVDTGIDIFHDCFRKPDGGASRLLGLWDQLLPTENPPGGFDYGVEFGPVDFEEAFDQPDQPFASQDVEGHGTHVAGTAAGDGSQPGNCHLSNHYIGVAPEAELCIVKSEFYGSTYVDGVRWIFDKANDEGKPAVVNLSLGAAAASHDGTSPEELALDALLDPPLPGRVIVVSAGNTAEDGLHGHRLLAASGSATLTFHVHPGDRFRLFGAIWYGGAGVPAGGPGADARVRLTVTTPDGAFRTVEPFTNPPEDALAGGRIDLGSFLHVGRPGRHQITFELSPSTGGSLIAGDWTLGLEETAGFETDVDCWLAPAFRLDVTEPIAANETKTFQFRVGEDVAGTESTRITYTGAARLAIKVTTPDPDSTVEVAADAGEATQACGSKHTVRFTCEVDQPAAGSHRITFFIDAPVNKTVDKGLWTVTLRETAGTATTVEAIFPERRPWIEVRDGLLSSHSEENAPRFIPADRETRRTVESPGSARNVITVGAYDPSDGNLAGFSSRGPTIDGREKPDLAAPGVGITAPKTRARGKSLCSDCCVDFYTDKQGTSMAAPHVTGVVALMLQKDPTLDFEAVRSALKIHARAVAGGDVNDWGAGKVDAQATVGAIVVSGGGGGGGGGGLTAPEDHGVILPLAAAWTRYVPTPHRIGELERSLSASPAGSLAMALVSKHVDEVARIVNEEKKVAAVWHRMEGPSLLRAAVGWEGGGRPPIPASHAGRPVAAGLARLLRTLERFASPALLADLRAYRAFALALPGATLADLIVPEKR